jgi:very-short-patch-repair endonuclease
VTTVPRTIVDMAADLGFDDLARACHEASVLHGVTPGQVEPGLARRPNAPGAKLLRAILHGDAPISLSKLERRFRRELQGARLLVPESNQYIDGHVVDCRWPARKLTVELDGYRYHRTRHAWERDRRRERAARARGDDFRRFTYGDVFERTQEVLGELRPILAIDGAGSGSRCDPKPVRP